MGDRKVRVLVVLIVVMALILFGATSYLASTGWPPFVMVILLVLLILLFLLSASNLYRRLYLSRLLDLPAFLRKPFPPPGFEAGSDPPPEIVLLRSPSAIGSGPDCGEMMGLGYLASVLRREGYRVKIVDGRLLALDEMQVVDLVLAYDAPILGINLNFEFLAESLSLILKALRRRGYSGHITLGGLYTSVSAEYLMEVIPETDSIIRFEGEETYLEFVRNIRQPESWSSIQGLVYRSPDRKVVINPLRPLISDLDSIPHPERDLLPLAVQRGGYAYVLSSRGCNGTCAYCIQQRSVSDPEGNRWRGRNPKDVVEEIADIVECYNTRNISFVDDDLFGGAKGDETHAHRLAQAIIECGLDIDLLISVQPFDVEHKVFKLLKKAGLASVILAVDNFSQPVLDRYCKMTAVHQNLRSIEILSALDIDAYLGIIMFDPWTTLQELENNFKIISTATISYLRPWQITCKLDAYYGGALTNKMLDEGILQRKGFTAQYDFIDPKVQSVHLALLKLIANCQPVVSSLDRFRWGSVGKDEIDDLVKQYHKAELNRLFVDYNQEIGILALGVVQQQARADAPLVPKELINRTILQRVRDLNIQVTQRIAELRVESMVTAEEL